MRRPSAVRIRGALAALLVGAACAHAPAALAFETLERLREPPRPHRAAYAFMIAGAGLVAASFPLTDAADRRYGEYLRETDIGRIESRWNRTVWADRIASGSLLTGESLLVLGTYLRFIRHAKADRVALAVGPGRCAVSLSF